MSAKKKPVTKKGRDSTERNVELPELALAAIVSYKNQKEVSNFINFLLEALDRNSNWVNTIADKQNNFRCGLMVGAGPNRFQLQEIIYPCGENDIKLEVEQKDSEDHDKIAIAALCKLNNNDIDHLLKYIKSSMFEKSVLREDLLKGKELGVGFAILRPFSDKQYRVMERIVIGSSVKCLIPVKKRRNDKVVNRPTPFKKKKVF